MRAYIWINTKLQTVSQLHWTQSEYPLWKRAHDCGSIELEVNIARHELRFYFIVGWTFFSSFYNDITIEEPATRMANFNFILVDSQKRYFGTLQIQFRVIFEKVGTMTDTAALKENSFDNTRLGWDKSLNYITLYRTLANYPSLSWQLTTMKIELSLFLLISCLPHCNIVSLAAGGWRLSVHRSVLNLHTKSRYKMFAALKSSHHFTLFLHFFLIVQKVMTVFQAIFNNHTRKRNNSSPCRRSSNDCSCERMQFRSRILWSEKNGYCRSFFSFIH